MKNKKTSVRFLTEAAIIAAIYAALTYLAAALNLAYGEIQFRVSEAFVVLTAFTPAAIPGLTIGCFFGNLGSPFGIIDVICGTAASGIAAILSYKLRHIKWEKTAYLVPAPAVFINAVIIGLEIMWFAVKGFSFAVFVSAFLWVFIGQTVVCYGLGLPLMKLIDKNRDSIFKPYSY